MANRIKVLEFVGDAIKGGVESVVYSYCNELKDDIETTFVFFDTSTSIPEDFVKSIGGHYYIVPNVRHLGKFRKEFRKVLTENKFDIIHSHVNTLSVFVLKEAKKCGYTVRIAHSHSQSNKKEFVRNLIKSVLKNFSKKYATLYLACGEITGRYQYGDKAFDKGEVTILKNAIDVDQFKFNQKDRDVVRKELGVKDDEILVGTLGRLCQTKNHQYILKMAERCPELKFVIVGGGPLEQELKDYMTAHNINNVNLYGLSDNPKRFYSAFDVFVLPSLYEGVPITGLEAQTNGVYVLFSSQVPSESQASSYVKFIPIGDENLSKWVDEIKVKHEHEDHVQEVVDSGFSIKEASKTLLKIYQSQLDK